MGLGAAVAGVDCLTRERIRKRKEREIERVVEKDVKRTKKGENEEEEEEEGREMMISRWACDAGLFGREEEEEQDAADEDKEVIWEGVRCVVVLF